LARIRTGRRIAAAHANSPPPLPCLIFDSKKNNIIIISIGQLEAEESSHSEKRFPLHSIFALLSVVHNANYNMRVLRKRALPFPLYSKGEKGKRGIGKGGLEKGKIAAYA
jgi:hypothetical protein